MASGLNLYSDDIYRHGIDPRINNWKIIFFVKKSFIIDKTTKNGSDED